jgi:WD40 repeat protein
MNYLLKQNALRLSTFPLILFQTAFNEPDSMPMTQLVANLWRRCCEIRPMFALTNKPQCRSARVMTLTGHSGAVTCVQFAPTAGLLVSGGSDSRALIWDIGRSGAVVATVVVVVVVVVAAVVVCLLPCIRYQ